MSVYFDLKRWTGLQYQRWCKCDDDTDRVEFLFQNFSTPRTSPAELNSLPTSLDRFLFLDGLNEVASTTGQEILRAFDKYTAFAYRTTVIMADRLVRREVDDPSKWLYATVLPLSDKEVKKQLNARGLALHEKLNASEDSSRILLSTPFFLDTALRNGSAAANGATAIQEFLLRHAGLSIDELERTADAAFELYRDYSSRAFELTQLQNRVGPDVITKLTSAGTLIVSKSTASFDHHLTHDYLAAHYFAQQDSFWRPDGFDALTFSASSFDSLAMVLEQLPSQAKADNFVRRLYDWNFYAAGYVLAEAYARETVQVSSPMQTVVLAMLADKRWDFVKGTRQRVADALKVLPLSVSKPFSEANSPQALWHYVMGTTAPQTAPWFRRWVFLFTRPANADATDDDVRCIADTDSVMGWTATNVLKRLKLSESQMLMIQSFTESSNPTVRWRVAHVLGAFSTQDNLTVLLRLFDEDVDKWVQYGATRSLIELAFRDTEIRKIVFMHLEARAQKIAARPACLNEFQNAVFVAKAPTEWLSAVRPVLAAIYKSLNSVEKRESLERLLYQLDLNYRSSDSSDVG